MSKKRGVSYEEKRQRIQGIFFEHKCAFNLKEVEKLGTKKGVVTMAIKEVLQSLVDDNLVELDKVGNQNIFWSFPSKAQLVRRNKITLLKKEIEEMKEKKAEEDKAEEELRVGREETEERSKLEAASAELTSRRATLDEKLKALRDNDPEVLEQLSVTAEKCKLAVNRWTDNAWTVKSYIVRKHGLSSSDVDRMLQLPAGLDYVE